jgi:hypothetical protein
MKSFKIGAILEIDMLEAKLSVNEEKIPLKDFMQDMLANVILGYLKSTKGVPENVKTIRIDINL